MEYEPRGDQEVAVEYDRTEAPERQNDEPRDAYAGQEQRDQQGEASFSDQERPGSAAPSYSDEERAPAYGTEASRGEETERGSSFD